MQEGKVKSGDKELTVFGTLSIGRTTDNDISFPNDSNVSRNHAKIQQLPDGFYVSDLGSSNGTAVNGVAITGPHKLQNGDYIILGNSGTVVFSIDGEDEPEDAEVEETSGQPELTEEEKKSNKVMLAGSAAALSLALVVGAGAFYFASGSACQATAQIISPEPGDTIDKPTDIEVASENAGCVAKAVFTIDGVEFATANSEPFEASIDPKDHPDLADGFDHVLGIKLIDKNGETIFAPAPVQLAFETRKVEGPANNTVAQNNSNTQTVNPSGKEVSLIEVQQMSQALAKNLSGNFTYNISNKDFLTEVRKRTAEYAQEGYYQRASQYRDVIRVDFVRGQDLNMTLGFVLAMSRSKFDPKKQGTEEGIYRMSPDFVRDNSYNGPCGTETLSDASQSCAAKAAGLYMKEIVNNIFNRDAVYGAAAFGKSSADAAKWRDSLSANRADIWNTIKGAQEREQVVRFFAAGIVAENPQKFGLKKDLPIAGLY